MLRRPKLSNNEVVAPKEEEEEDEEFHIQQGEKSSLCLA
jgi:hypothetical protein